MNEPKKQYYTTFADEPKKDNIRHQLMMSQTKTILDNIIYFDDEPTKIQYYTTLVDEPNKGNIRRHSFDDEPTKTAALDNIC